MWQSVQTNWSEMNAKYILLIDRNDDEVLGEQIDMFGPAFDLRVAPLFQTVAHTQQFLTITNSLICITSHSAVTSGNVNQQVPLETSGQGNSMYDCIAATHASFNRIRQVAPLCTPIYD